jgi:hypothetical protein
MSKKPFSTQVDETISNLFRQKCKQNGESVTDVTEALLYLYANDKIQLEKRVTYDIKNKGECN